MKKKSTPKKRPTAAKPRKNKAANAVKRKATKTKTTAPKTGRKASSSALKKSGGLLSKLFGKKEKPATKKPTQDKLISVKLKRHKDKNRGHHHIILEDLEDKHISVGLTTKKTKGENSKASNYKLETSPLNDGKESYMRRQGTVDAKKNYGKEVTAGVMTPKDYSKAKEYGARAKQKYLEKKAQKKQ